MSGRTYKTRGIVLRKTKLGEKDLIVTFLGEDGSLCKAVAKGARKPGGSLAAKLEVFSAADMMLAKGRNLDVVTEARFVGGAPAGGFGIEQAACAAPIAELVCALAQEELPSERLYAMTVMAIEAIGSSDPATAVMVCAADLLKTFAITGFRPSFNVCVSCGNPIDSQSMGPTVPVSVSDGGVVCGECTKPADAFEVDRSIVEWSQSLMYSTFSDIQDREPDVSAAFGVLQLVRQWARFHVGRNLKSLDFLFTSGLY